MRDGEQLIIASRLIPFEVKDRLRRPPQAAALRAVLEFKFSLRSNVAARFKGKWLRSSRISGAIGMILRIFDSERGRGACGANRRIYKLLICRHKSARATNLLTAATRLE
jgi:hypothetical protein